MDYKKFRNIFQQFRLKIYACAHQIQKLKNKNENLKGYICAKINFNFLSYGLKLLNDEKVKMSLLLLEVRNNFFFEADKTISKFKIKEKKI
ncbi:hypothetical protein BpHYR1_051071 [Brachionus plicatilis]|uniref:Uncharacterized protein n=1 Tax=Brachionus plicatilis TaxID=10195 RepID=A0A3M7QUZ4_BRAPC|nr:hypothetical protein BpHYR1_051071 [Brachionus plicatilis]